MGKKGGKSPGKSPSVPTKKARSGFVTINSVNSVSLHAAVKKKQQQERETKLKNGNTGNAGGNAGVSMSADVGRVRLWQSKTEKVDECCYAGKFYLSLRGYFSTWLGYYWTLSDTLQSPGLALSSISFSVGIVE